MYGTHEKSFDKKSKGTNLHERSLRNPNGYRKRQKVTENMQALKILTSVENFDLVYGKVITRAAMSLHYVDYYRA